MPSLSKHGAQFRGLQVFFFKIKMTAVRQVRMSLHLLQSECEDKTCVKRCMACEDSAFVFVWAVGKNRRPKLRPIADDAIICVGIGGLGSLVYICGDKCKVKQFSEYFKISHTQQ